MAATKRQKEPEESWMVEEDDPETCVTCDGTGLLAGRKCKDCDGKGFEPRKNS